jgi:2-oxo-3-hexenedioate decarboxylase
MWGMVYDRTTIDAPHGAASVSLDGLVNPRIEPEICFGLKASPRADNVLEAIDWVAHSVEIVQCHHPGWKVTIADCTADNGLHGRLIVGPREQPMADMEAKLPGVEARLYKSGALVDRGVGANVLGSPLIALRYLVELLARHSAPALAAGEVISTGVITDAHPVTRGERWRTEIVGMPLRGLEIKFT